MRLITSRKSVEKEWGPGPYRLWLPLSAWHLKILRNGAGRSRSPTSRSQFHWSTCRPLETCVSITVSLILAGFSRHFHFVLICFLSLCHIPESTSAGPFGESYWVKNGWQSHLLCQELFATVGQAFLIFLDWLLCLIHSTVALFDSTSSMFHRCHPPRGETWQDGWEQHLRRANIFGLWKGVVSNSSWKAKKRRQPLKVQLYNASPMLHSRNGEAFLTFDEAHHAAKACSQFKAACVAIVLLHYDCATIALQAAELFSEGTLDGHTIEAASSSFGIGTITLSRLADGMGGTSPWYMSGNVRIPSNANRLFGLRIPTLY